VFVRSRSDTALEVLALRQQVAVLKRQRPWPTLTRLDRSFWASLRHLWPRWSDVLLIVKPETVVGWHRARFCRCWRWRSRRRRPASDQRGDADPAPPPVGGACRRGCAQNPRRTRDARFRRLRTPCRKVSATPPTPRRSRHRWAAFLANHREAIVAVDSFTVPTLTFQRLSGFFVIERHRRTILHVNVTCEPPPLGWCNNCAACLEMVRIAPSCSTTSPTCDGDVIAFPKATGLDPTRTGLRRPWQHGIAERGVGSCRRERPPAARTHLSRLIRASVAYSNQDRTHDALGNDAPNRRAVEPKPAAHATVISMARAGGLHHRYSLAQRGVRARRRSRHRSVLGLRCQRCVTRTSRCERRSPSARDPHGSCVCGQRSLRRLAGLILVTQLQGLSGKLRLPW
jgi:putative transposase